MGTLGEISEGTNPIVSGASITDLQQSWKKDLYAGTDALLTGKDSAGNTVTESSKYDGIRQTP